nr:UvrB/UvrC motif-containing protein [Bacillus piscicola]
MCEECQKRPASIHLTKIVNGQKTQINLCEECAREKGETIPNWSNYSIQDLLSGLLHFEQPTGHESVRSSQTMPRQLVCNNCGLSYDRLINIGRFGCSHCYETFGSKLDPIFKRVHGGNTKHAGKIPKQAGSKFHIKKQIEKAREHLEDLIEREEFEEAAKVRDHIRDLQSRAREGEGRS